MSDAPTPETDAFYSPSGFRTDEDSKDFARRLERERDEAREALRIELAMPTHLLDVHAITNERDELRARVAELEGALDWYVENDDVMEGDHWDEDNAFWIAGKRRAEELLAKKEADNE